MARVRLNPMARRSKRMPTPPTYTTIATVAHDIPGWLPSEAAVVIGPSSGFADATSLPPGAKVTGVVPVCRRGTASLGPHATKTGSKSITTVTTVHAVWASRGERIRSARRTTATPKASRVTRTADSARMAMFIVLSSCCSARAPASLS